MKRIPPADRFWAKVDRSGGAQACWHWTGYRNPKGYGRFRVNGHLEYATRWIYGETVGTIPESHGVLHRCDNPPCVNPAHLFTGTNAANVADRVAKGRTRVPVGEDHWAHQTPEQVRRGQQIESSKLTPDQVRAIRDRYAVGDVSQRALADQYRVSQPMIGQIIRRVWWQHI